MLEKFQKVYKNMEWGRSRLYPECGSSGRGSSVEYLRELISFLERYILENKFSSFLDIGCGECEWQRSINWEKLNCQYIGIELMPDVVERAKKDLAERKNMTLMQGNCLEIPLPETDLTFTKEVFQHWSIQTTNQFLKKLIKTSKNNLTYNCDSSVSFFLYSTYRYFISKELEIHDEVANEIAKKLCSISWDINTGEFRPCNFDIYGKRLATFKWKWHFPASLVLIERVAEENEIDTISFNDNNIFGQIDLFTGGAYKDTDLF